MKVIVRESVNHIATPQIKTYKVIIDALNSYNKIPQDIGLMKGDLIIFRGAGDPIRFASGNAAGKILLTDPTTESGWTLSVPAASAASIALHNDTGLPVAAGTVVVISSGTDFVKAASTDSGTLYVTADDCPAGEDVACYGPLGSICLIQCTSAAVSAGDLLTVSSTAGQCCTATDGDREVAVAITAKASGSAGTVKAILTGTSTAATAPLDSNNRQLATTAFVRKEILYFYQEAVSTASNAEIFRITNDLIDADTVVLECTFADPSYITSDISWTSAAGYISFIGTCTTATTANVTLGRKGN